MSIMKMKNMYSAAQLLKDHEVDNMVSCNIRKIEPISSQIPQKEQRINGLKIVNSPMYKNEGGIEFSKETNQNKITPINSTLSNHKIVLKFKQESGPFGIKNKIERQNSNLRFVSNKPEISKRSPIEEEVHVPCTPNQNLNDTLEEEIHEEIVCAPEASQYELFDPYSGERIQKELESSGSVFTGRDELKVIKLKRKRDAEAYSKFLQDQIDEKNRRKLSINKEEFRDNITYKSEKKTLNMDNQNNIVNHNDKLEPTSSRYSNSNTACTRNLFTPSEDNCLSQHLICYSSIKQSKVQGENDQIITGNDSIKKIKKIKNQTCNTVMEERSREEANTEESIFSLKSPQHISDKISNKDYITISNQEVKESSILLLEGAVEALLKEQQSLK